MICMNLIRAVVVSVVCTTAGLAIAGTHLIGTNVVLGSDKKAEKPTPPGGPETVSGLSISVKPGKAAFAVKEQMSFTVTIKNTTKKPFLLYLRVVVFQEVEQFVGLAGRTATIRDGVRETSRDAARETDERE